MHPHQESYIRERSNQLFEHARSLAERGDRAQARAALFESYGLEPRAAAASLIAGLCAADRNSVEAGVWYERAYSLNERQSRYATEYARWLAENGQPEEASRIATCVLERHADYGPARDLVAQLGRTRSAGERAARRVVRAWRTLTGGSAVRDDDRRTIVACSGGADSSALLIALAQSARPGMVVAVHVVHDMRPAAQAHADRDATAALAERLGVAFATESIRAHGLGRNIEAASRSLRYAALVRLAAANGCTFIATGHHADDQLETMLMRLIRGAGVQGLAGIARRRVLASPAGNMTLIRPMLAIGREQATFICAGFGWRWQEDETNADERRLRSALRTHVTPFLRHIRSQAAGHANETAELCRQAWALIDEESEKLVGRSDASSGVISWARSDLKAASPIVASEALRRAILRASGGQAQDRITQRSIGAAIRAIRDRNGERREFQWRGARMVVTGTAVTIEPVATPSQ
ncbi:MAG: tRNA lysidine(34) synthetase TilS [Phycisphaerales bacterium]|nr:tRNA lysidine(34) synthetase TilS [Phycisphaerales bacterium]